MFEGESGAGTNNATAKADANAGGEQAEGKGVEFSAEQQKHIDKLIGDARKDGARAAADKVKAEQEEAAKKRDEEAAKERGEFEQIAQTREQERDKARQEAAALTATLDQYREAVQLVIAKEWDALPTEAIEAYEAAGGKDDDSLGKLSFLPAGKKIAAKLAEKVEAPRGNGRDPVSAGGKKSNEEAARKATSAMYRNF